jgi:hypothetical protein
MGCPCGSTICANRNQSFFLRRPLGYSARSASYASHARVPGLAGGVSSDGGRTSVMVICLPRVARAALQAVGRSADPL